MNNFWVDPFGLNLIQKSEEQTNMPNKKEEKGAPAASTVHICNGLYPYYYHPMPMASQIIYYGNGCCHPQQPQQLPAPEEKRKSCSEYECKACKKAEEKGKVFVTKSSFWNPRQPRKGVFEK